MLSSVVYREVLMGGACHALVDPGGAQIEGYRVLLLQTDRALGRRQTRRRGWLQVVMLRCLSELGQWSAHDVLRRAAALLLH